MAKIPNLSSQDSPEGLTSTYVNKTPRADSATLLFPKIDFAKSDLIVPLGYAPECMKVFFLCLSQLYSWSKPLGV